MAEMMEESTLPTDDRFSQIALSKLSISKPATSISNKLMLPEFDQNTWSQKQPKWIQKSNGVPGFPDFPDFWVGEEGWAVWKRNHASTNRGKHNNNCEKVERRRPQQKPVQREVVNAAGTRRGQIRCKSEKIKKQVIPRKRTEDRKMRCFRLKQKREMVSLRRSLASLSCK